MSDEKYKAPIGEVVWMVRDQRDGHEYFVQAHTAFDACVKASHVSGRDLDMSQTWTHVEQLDIK